MQNRFTGKLMALKIIKNLDESRVIESRVEPFVLGELSNWGGLKVAIIESKYSDRFICLETPTEMLEAYNSRQEFKARLKLEKICFKR